MEQSAVTRRLNESRKVTLAHGLASSMAGTVSTVAVNMDALPVVSPNRPRKGITADFLEDGLGLRDLKNQYKRGVPVGKRRRVDDDDDDDDDDEEEDVEFEDESEASFSDDSLSSSSSSSSSSGSSSDDPSDSSSM